MTDYVFHLDGPAQPCGEEYPAHYLPRPGLPSYPAPSPEIDALNASARANYTARIEAMKTADRAAEALASIIMYSSGTDCQTDALVSLASRIAALRDEAAALLGVRS